MRIVITKASELACCAAALFRALPSRKGSFKHGHGASDKIIISPIPTIKISIFNQLFQQRTQLWLLHTSHGMPNANRKMQMKNFRTFELKITKVGFMPDDPDSINL